MLLPSKYPRPNQSKYISEDTRPYTTDASTPTWLRTILLTADSGFLHRYNERAREINMIDASLIESVVYLPRSEYHTDTDDTLLRQADLRTSIGTGSFESPQQRKSTCVTVGRLWNRSAELDVLFTFVESMSSDNRDQINGPSRQHLLPSQDSHRLHEVQSQYTAHIASADGCARYCLSCAPTSRQMVSK